MKVNGLRVSNLEGLYNKQRKAGRQPLVKAVRCSKCNNLSAFENEDISVCLQQTEKGETLRGYVKCPWCGNKMFVSEWKKDTMQLIGKYYTELSGE